MPAPVLVRPVLETPNAACYGRVRGNSVLNPDLAFVALVLFLALVVLMDPGGPGTPRRVRERI